MKATRHRAPYHWVKGQLPAGKEKHPVVNVSWDDAVAFCAWDGRSGCRPKPSGNGPAAESRKAQMYPVGRPRDHAEGRAFRRRRIPTPVCGDRTRNYFGLCDMIGNVWEWTSDWYLRTYYKESPPDNPPGPPKGMYRVLRGGSWFDEPPLFLTCSYRSWARPAERSPTVGFRCAKSFPTPPNRASR